MLLIILTFTGPAEKTLGTNARIVYLHGAWVWVALIMFFLSALVGSFSLLTRTIKPSFWIRAYAWTGLIFWVTYLPISMWAMQANWNGLFLAEPRWRVAVIFAIGGLLLQAGLYLVNNFKLDAFFNTAYWAALMWAINRAEQVMHPPSPIFDSEATRIQAFFIILTLVTLGLAIQVSRIINSRWQVLPKK